MSGYKITHRDERITVEFVKEDGSERCVALFPIDAADKYGTEAAKRHALLFVQAIHLREQLREFLDVSILPGLF